MTRRNNEIQDYSFVVTIENASTYEKEEIFNALKSVCKVSKLNHEVRLKEFWE